MNLKIGPGFDLPLDWMSMATVVFGTIGSGKTNFGTVLAEEAHRAGQRFCAVDIKGDYYGLRSSKDGKGPGIPVIIFGGDHADVPLNENSGALVGRLVAELPQSCIIDLEHMRKGAQIRFLTQFFEALYHHNRDPLLLLLDEAQRYAPQNTKGGGDIVVCLGAVEDLVKLGRKHGIFVVLFTQRGAGLNKEVVELCGMLAAFRTPGVLDQERIREWLGANVTKAVAELVLSNIAGLDTGTAVFASGHPRFKIAEIKVVRERWTFDSSTTPEPGQRRREPKNIAPVDLAAIRDQMAESIERAKAEDPRELRRRIAELERTLAAATRELDAVGRVAPERVTIEVERLVLTDPQVDRLFDAAQAAATAATAIRAEAQGISDALARIPASAVAKGKPLPAAPKPTAPAPTRGVTKPPIISAEKSHSNGKGPTGPQQKILDGLAWLHAVGVEDVSWTLMAFFGNASPKSSGFRANVSALRSAGLIRGGKKDGHQLTEAGAAMAVHPEVPGTNEELWETIRRGVSGPQWQMLDVLIAAYPDAVDWDALAESARQSPLSSGYRANISQLRSLELVEGGRREGYRASERLFL